MATLFPGQFSGKRSSCFSFHTEHRCLGRVAEALGSPALAELGGRKAGPVVGHLLLCPPLVKIIC